MPKVTVNISNDEDDDILTVAHKLHLSKSAVIRFALNGNLHKCQFIKLNSTERKNLADNRKSALNALAKIMTKSSQLTKSWRRLGANFDQILHLANDGYLQGLGYRLNRLNHLISKKELDQRSNHLERGLTAIWQLLQSPLQKKDITH